MLFEVERRRVGGEAQLAGPAVDAAARQKLPRRGEDLHPPQGDDRPGEDDVHLRLPQLVPGEREVGERQHRLAAEVVDGAAQVDLAGGGAGDGREAGEEVGGAGQRPGVGLHRQHQRAPGAAAVGERDRAGHRQAAVAARRGEAQVADRLRRVGQGAGQAIGLQGRRRHGGEVERRGEGELAVGDRQSARRLAAAGGGEPGRRLALDRHHHRQAPEVAGFEPQLEAAAAGRQGVGAAGEERLLGRGQPGALGRDDAVGDRQLDRAGDRQHAAARRLRPRRPFEPQGGRAAAGERVGGEEAVRERPADPRRRAGERHVLVREQAREVEAGQVQVQLDRLPRVLRRLGVGVHHHRPAHRAAGVMRVGVLGDDRSGLDGQVRRHLAEDPTERRDLAATRRRRRSAISRRPSSAARGS